MERAENVVRFDAAGDFTRFQPMVELDSRGPGGWLNVTEIEFPGNLSDQ